MNLKQAKRLRKMAQRHTVGLENVAYQPLKAKTFRKKDPLNPEKFLYAAFTGQVVLAKKCTRHEYHNAKKAYARAKPHVLKMMAIEGLRRPA